MGTRSVMDWLIRLTGEVPHPATDRVTEVPLCPPPKETPSPVSITQYRIGSTKASLLDGATMVYVPSGDFTMGSTEYQFEAAYQAALVWNMTLPRSSFAMEAPQHNVYLDAYWIDKTPVTVAQFRKFSNSSGHPMPHAPSWGWKDNHPIVNVSWEYANAYAQWAGKRLPTEAEWEKAARGTDGRLYPWGNDWDTSRLQSSKAKRSGGEVSSIPVGSFPMGASPFGAVDMVGNVLQWCSDWYGEKYYEFSPDQNPTGPENGQLRVLRGAPWSIVSASSSRVVARHCAGPGQQAGTFGFRCVEDR